MDIGLKIKKWREGAGVTQVELAAMVGVSLRTVQNWEKGGGIKVADFARVAESLDVPAADAGEAIAASWGQS